jgi:two-component system phosphate regulon sensor histidine kinase PhoR
MHRILERQIKRYLGESITIPPEWRDFFESISKTYDDFDDDKILLNRSLELSSKEFLENYQRLEEIKVKIEKQAQNLALEVDNRTKDLNKQIGELKDVRTAMMNLLEDFEEKQKALAESKAKDEALLESIGEGLIAVDNDKKIMIINKVATDMLGYETKNLIGKVITDLNLEDENSIPVPLDKRPTTIALVTGKAVKVEYIFVRENKTKFPIAITATPFKLEGKTLGLIEIIRDITHEKVIDRAKTEFISIASHQLRTPVSGLSWLTEALRFSSENLDPKQKTYIRDLSILSKRLIGLVEDLLNVSRIQLKSELIAEKRQIDFVVFVEETIREIELYAKSKKHTIIFNTDIKEPIVVELNKKSLYNILQNLVSNAIEYSPENTAVTVKLEKIDGFLKVSVLNKGPFIPMNEQAHLFQRFYRGESGKKMKGEGTGLGLYIIKMIVEEMGGKVGFESKEGMDTTFWFTIPLKTVKS